MEGGGVMKYKLEEICIQIYSGGTPSTSHKEYWGGNIPWLSSGETSQRFVYTTEKFITEEGSRKSSAKLAKKSFTVMASAGQGHTRGQVSYLMNDMYVNQSILVFYPNESIVEPLYLYYNLDGRYEELRQLSDGTSTRGSLSGRIVKDMEIELPDRTIQEKIVGILYKIDSKIETNNLINRNLEEQAFTLFDLYFPGVMYGEKKIGDYIIPSRGKNLLSKDAVPGNVPVVAGGLSPATYHNEANTVAPVLTISASGANAGYVGLWNQSVWSSDSSYIDSRMTDKVYFWYVLLKKRQKEIFDSQAGSAQPHIYPKHIESMPVIDLDIDNIEKYMKEVTPMFTMIGFNNKEIVRLAILRDSLLPKLMSGELDVSELNI